jgi:ATP:ADP antiporter, AAA family
MSEKTFGIWRQRLWPIQRFELKKLIPLLLMKFLISLNYAILTCMKDTMVVTAKGSGAEVIPVLKGWVVLPAAILATLIYSKLSNLMKRTTLFYLTLSIFLFIIVGYGFFLYPNIDTLSPNASADALQSFLHGKGAHWVAVFRNWIPSLFFVTAELWGGFVIFILFWGFTNQISVVGEAKRTYTLYIAAGDLASIVTGPIIWYFAKKYAHLDFTFTLQKLVLLIALFGVIIMGLHYYITNRILKDPRFTLPEKVKDESKKKTKLSLLQSIKHIGSSKYLFNIAIMVIGYGLAINMIEVSWKANLKLLHPDPSHYQAYMGTVTTIIGIVALITVLLVGGGILRFFGWRFSAQITPIVLGSTGVLFFSLLILRKFFPTSNTFLGLDILTIIVTVGAIQNITSKVMKYSFFDPTKEMAFIPLDTESKTKGKAAIDVVGSRLGKSGSAWIQIGLIDLLGTASILSITHLLLPIIIVAVIAWMSAIRYVNRQFQKKTAALS